MPAFFTISHLDVFDLQVRSPSLGGIFSQFRRRNCSSARPTNGSAQWLGSRIQTVPDAIHSDQAEKVILRAGQVFTSKTSYHAIAKK